MIEPEVTAVLGRRYLAFLIDSSLVVATGLGVALQQSSSFDVVGRDAQGQPLIDPAEFDAFSALRDEQVFGLTSVLGRPLVRAQEFGDSLRVFGSDAYRAGFIAAAVVAFVVFALIPMVLQRTIGMIPTGLEIKTTEGRNAGPLRHLLRSIVGVVDMVPGVLPGALGFLRARGSELRQRLGDTVAGTAVVSRRAFDLSEIPEEHLDLRLGDNRAPVAAPEPVATDAHLDADGDTDGAAPSTLEPNVSEPAASVAVPPPPAHRPTAPLDTVGSDRSVATEPTTSPADGAHAAQASKPPVAKPTVGDPLPPPPVHRKPPSERPLGTSANSSDPADKDGTDRTIARNAAESAQTTAADPTDPDPTAAAEVDAPTASVERHMQATQEPLPLDIATTGSEVATPDGAWLPPREEPAPVWQPSPLETAPVQAPDPHDGRTLDDVVLGSPSVGRLVSESPLPADSPLLTDTEHESADAGLPGGRQGSHSRTTPSAKTPVWSDKWRAWMYWDSTKKCWLRHDTTTNAWERVD